MRTFIQHRRHLILIILKIFKTRTKEQNKKGLAKFLMCSVQIVIQKYKDPSQEAEKELNEYLSMQEFLSNMIPSIGGRFTTIFPISEIQPENISMYSGFKCGLGKVFSSKVEAL
ncbi:hypothetical protein TNIN_303501 [Trichonephila inaurata madagascariensis]|uniref:Uncharacterized protein n=1 Tax=Trichonephila inaurata madagascariensis TaxID=2747483 RepID=A0A8X6YB39_9ARAC|nr:hypothetical protein TNIN_303501 [Trichonephila inaurata madagascariensis]